MIAVPDSANSAALGFAEESGIPFELGLLRNHYVGRTFIQPSQKDRDFGARMKYNPVREVLDGKRIVVVDDSLVRGTTSRSLVRMLRAAGASEVHFRIASPPVRFPCFYGIDMPTKGELIGLTAGGPGDRREARRGLPRLPLPGGHGGRRRRRVRPTAPPASPGTIPAALVDVERGLASVEGPAGC